ncbi:MAG: MCE family protein [Deltaproteobacteria bacterium]|nr:MCE family protein [Deltaproteobacteria bacterium]
MGKTRLKVGLFVLISLIILVGAIVWLTGSRFLRQVAVYDIVFTKSVSGLLPGAAVEYQGVTVGKVERIRLTEDTPPQVVVSVALEPVTKVRQDTTAALLGSLVTGIRIVELEGGSPTTPLLEPGGVIPVRGGEFEEFRDRASQVAERLTNVLTRIEEDLLSAQNSAAITEFLRNAARLSESLRVSLDDVSTAESRASLKAMVDNIAQAAASMKHVTDAINDMRGELLKDGKSMIAQVQQTAADTATLAKDVAQLTRQLNELVGENRQEIKQALTNLAETSRALKATADSVQSDPSTLIWGHHLPEKDIPDQ